MMSVRVVVAASLLASGAVALPAAARVDAVHKADVADKRPGVVREQFLGNFGSCSVQAEYSLKDGAVFKKDWGDYFFRLFLGYSPKNGGWNRWDFLQVFAKTEKGLVNVLEKSRPVTFAGYSAGGADFLAAEWETSDGNRLKLRFAAFPSHRDWLFLRVELSDIPVARVCFSAYPGNAAAQEGRERHLATKERDWHLNVEGADFAPVSPLLLMYSRYFDDRFGNKLVFEPSQAERVRCNRTSAGVTVQFMPAKGAQAETFALGYFAHKSPDDQLTRFLGEDGDAIYDFMKAINWNAEPKSDDFKASVRIALSMGIDKATLNGIARRYLSAARERDIAAISKCAAEVEELRRSRVRDGLAEFL